VGPTLTLNKSIGLISTCKASLPRGSPVHATSPVQIYDEPSSKCDVVGEPALCPVVPGASEDANEADPAFFQSIVNDPMRIREEGSGPVHRPFSCGGLACAGSNT